MVLKNILTVELTMPTTGIVLDPSETITYAEIGDADFVSSCSDEITEFVALNKIKVFQDDGVTELSLTDVATQTSGEKSTLSLGNLEELAVAISPHANRRFMFLRDSFEMKKNKTVKKPFPGSVGNINIRPKNGSVMVQLYSDNVLFQEEEIKRNAIFQYELDYKMSDVMIIMSGSHSNKNTIDIYADGDTYLDSALVQEVVDGWAEDSPSHSALDKYNFDE